MITSQTITLFDPSSDSKIPKGTLAYVKAKLRQSIYNVMVKEFKDSGVSQAELARRLDRDPAIISKNFAGPGNMTIDTIAEVIFAANGSFLHVHSCKHPSSYMKGKLIELSSDPTHNEHKIVGPFPALNTASSDLVFS